MSASTIIAAPRQRLGDIFVEQGLITPVTAERVFQKSKQLNRRFGTVLEDLELITSAELAAALAIQYGCKVVNALDKLAVSPQTLAMIPVEVAIQHLVFPLKRDANRLAVAMADPTDLTVGDLLPETSLQLIPYIASKEDIRAAICHHYMSKVAGRSQKRTIITVDDDPLVHPLLADSLKGQGYEILTANDGMEAFRQIVSKGPHVVITDQEMPKFSGYALLSALRNIPETSYIPVLLLTGKPQDEQEEVRAFERGFFDVIFKPFNPASVQARVKRAFHFYDNQYRVF